jgi:dihydropteroate synthase
MPAMLRKRYEWKIGKRSIILGRKTAIMAILNVTPDSFSDGGKYLDPNKAVERALEMESLGADIIDIGGESTKPGASPVQLEEELRRVMPVIERLVSRIQVPMSIDTTKYEVAKAALDAGVEIINDVTGLRVEPRLADLAKETGAGLILMNMRGEPRTMQQIPPSSDILADVADDLKRAIEGAEKRGVPRDQLVLDPGIGFGKTAEQNCEIINHLDHFAQFDFPLMIGPSRKSFIGKLLNKEPVDRLWGTAGSVAASILRGAHIVRVHDVREMADVARIADLIQAA